MITWKRSYAGSQLHSIVEVLSSSPSIPLQRNWGECACAAHQQWRGVWRVPPLVIGSSPVYTNPCLDTISLPLWLALMGLLSQIYKPLPWYCPDDMLVDLADWDQTAESLPLWLIPLDLLSLDSRIGSQITKSSCRMGMPSPSPRRHCHAEVALHQI